MKLRQLITNEHVLIDGFESTTGWAALNSDTTTLAASTKHVTGTGALSFAKVNGAANTIFGGVARTLPQTLALGGNASSGNGPGPRDVIAVTFYVSAITDIAYAYVRLGTDASNYNEWRVPDSSITAGVFNTVELPIGEASYTGITGNGWNPAAVAYAEVGIAFDLETNTLSGIVFDRLSYRESLRTDSVEAIVAALGAVTVTSGSITETNSAAIAASLSVMDDWDETNRAAVNPIAGQVGIAGGTGVDGATVPRVSLATNVGLPAGTNAIGKLAANSGVDIGDVDVTSVPADPFGLNADAASLTGSLSAKLRALATAIGTIGDAASITGSALAQLRFLGTTGAPRVRRVLDFTPTLDTSAYAAGDLLADVGTLGSAVTTAGDSAELKSLVVIDSDDQKQPFDVYIFSASVSMGTFNLPPTVSDSSAGKLVARIEVAASDYFDLGGVSVAVIKNIAQVVKPDSGVNLNVGLVTRGTPTHTASGLLLRFGLEN